MLRAHIITKVIAWFNLSNNTHIHCCKITCVFLIFCIEHWTFSLLDYFLCNHISGCNLACVEPVDNLKDHVTADFSLCVEIMWCQQIIVLHHFFLWALLWYQPETQFLRNNWITSVAASIGFIFMHRT